ncbi:hypothetical protein KEM52_004436, partial [Ascosphaera acerosa]
GASRTATPARQSIDGDGDGENNTEHGTACPPLVPFPPPQTFDIIPPLHDLLARLLKADAAGQIAATLSGHRESTAAPPTSTAPSAVPGASTGLHTRAGSTAASVAASTAGATLSIDPKTLQIESAAIRRKIQRAQAAVDALPDMNRTVDEQQAEIDDMEKRVARLREVLADFGVRSGEVLRGMT